MRLLACMCVLLLGFGSTALARNDGDTARDILVTFRNDGAKALSGGFGAPYRNRKSYTIAAEARQNADAIANEYALVEIDHWPIRSLSVYCFVYRVPEDVDRDTVIARLRTDVRVESIQPLQEFETGTSSPVEYDDTYAGFQHGLDTMGVAAAHQRSLGQGVRIAIVDSLADVDHEDLAGRVSLLKDFTSAGRKANAAHGTAVASVIGASANNAKGIVGVAPEATLEIYVSCWAGPEVDKAICDSFTLAKSFDTLLDKPPDILNLSLAGPHDPLLERLLVALSQSGTIVVAAMIDGGNAPNHFPASMDSVIGVASSRHVAVSAEKDDRTISLYAPGTQIIVAIPNNAYDYRSGSSLAAAHVSGVIALLLAISPELSFESVYTILRHSQDAVLTDTASVNACIAVKSAAPATICGNDTLTSLKLKPGANDDT